MSPQLRQELATFYRSALLGDTLPFWFPRAIDPENGGYFGCFDRDGTLVDTDKSVWQQGRSAWLLATLYNTLEQRPEWLEWAASGITFLEMHAFDTDGRMFFQTTADGTPLRKRRYIFSECFACSAFAAVAKATGSSRHADRARALLALITRHYDDPSLFLPKFTGARPAKSIGLPMILLNVAQIVRKNLGDDTTPLIDRIIDEIRTDFVKPDLQAVLETVAPDGSVLDHFDGRTLNPGHAIEAAWFILDEARHRNNDPELVRLGTQILDFMWARGWDPQHGGLLYFTSLDARPVQEYWHDMKFWWPHNETIIATLLAHTLTNEPKYASWHGKVHDWSHTHFPDKQHGEWFGNLHRDGTPSSTLKGNLWKGCFHLPRMQLYAHQILAGTDPLTA